MTTRRRPRRARPAGRDRDVDARAGGLQRQLAAQARDVGAGDVELDGRDGVAGQPPDAVDVGPVRGDPGGHGGDGAGEQRGAEDDDGRAAAARGGVVAGAGAGP